MLYYEITSTACPAPWNVNEGDYRTVYDIIMKLTGNHDLSADAEGWCELASVGEVYEEDLFTIEVIEE